MIAGTILFSQKYSSRARLGSGSGPQGRNVILSRARSLPVPPGALLTSVSLMEVCPGAREKVNPCLYHFSSWGIFPVEYRTESSIRKSRSGRECPVVGMLTTLIISAENSKVVLGHK